MREYGKVKAKLEEPILLEFPVESLYFIMEFMSKAEGKPLTTLTKLAVLFLQPPAPFENKTIQPSELVEQIVSGAEKGNESRILLASVTASTSQEALAKLQPLLEKQIVPSLFAEPEEEQEGSSLVE